jgi:hypothetical protein
MAETARARRWDAGTVRVHERDLRLLRVIGEDGGARLALVSELLAAMGGGRSEAAARHWTDRMVRGGYLRRSWVLRAAWFTLTPAGGRLVDLVDRKGRASPRVIEAATMVDHTNTVGRLRLHLAREYPEARWIPERTFWAEQRDDKNTAFRRPDGALDFGDRKVGLEVELTPKDSEDYRDIAGQTYPGIGEVWWYVPPELEGRIRRTITTGVNAYEATEGPFSVRKAKPYEVRALPEGVWP